jgi:hypothetical protein
VSDPTPPAAPGYDLARIAFAPVPPGRLDVQLLRPLVRLALALVRRAAPPSPPEPAPRKPRRGRPRRRAGGS